MVVGITLLFPIIPGLLGTMIGTQIYHVLKSSSARTARIKATGAILILFAFMLFMFCKFPDIAVGNLGDKIRKYFRISVFPPQWNFYSLLPNKTFNKESVGSDTDVFTSIVSFP